MPPLKRKKYAMQEKTIESMRDGKYSKISCAGKSGKVGNSRKRMKQTGGLRKG
jgi:hypothetical protein